MSAQMQSLSAAIQHHQAGRLHEAELLYRQILTADPRHADAMHLLGVIAHQVGRHDLAVQQIEAAIRLQGNNPEMHSNLGAAYSALGRFTEAADCYHRALRLRPDFASAHYCLGNVLQKQGRLQEAVASYRRALQFQPNSPETHNNLGNVLRQLGDLPGAIDCFRNAVRLRPAFAEAYVNMGDALHTQRRFEEAIVCFQQALQHRPVFAEAYASLGAALLELKRPSDAAAALQQSLQIRPDVVEVCNNLGNAYLGLKRMAEATSAYRRALQLRPDFAEARNNLGNAQQGQGNLAEAVESYREALRLRPDFAEAHNNLGTVLLAQGLVDEAAAATRQAIEIQPNSAEYQNNFANTLKAQGNVDAAIAGYRRALEIQPDHPDAHRNLGIALLLRGEWDAGWREYEWRWRCPDFGPQSFSQPRWDGAALNGKTILLHAEQGLGDTIQFVRYAPLVQQRGGRVILQCQAPLVPLLANVGGIERIIAQGQPVPPCDFQAPLLSLPMLFETTPSTVPGPAPYLQADTDRRSRWRNWLEPHPGRKIGIYWQRNTIHKRDWSRSVRVASLAPLAEAPATRLVALQIGNGREQLAEFAERWQILDPALTSDERGETFLDLAALLCELDLVVAVDTAVVHLAGALGVRAWIAVAHPPDWRWLMEGEDTPWYPSVRIFRQERRGDWDSVFARMAAELSRCATKI